MKLKELNNFEELNLPTMKEAEERRLENRNVRPTAMRILVLRYLMEKNASTSLLDLEQNFELAERSTLFRTLKTFEKNGIVHTIDDGSGVLKYALCLESCECSVDDQHFHFHCEKCNETYCMTSIELPAISLPKDFSMNQVNFVIKGKCANCN